MDKLEKKALRKDFSSIGWALMIYLALMNVLVIVFMIADGIIFMFQNMAGGASNTDDLMNQMMGNGWGYILTCLAGALILRLWKGKGYYTKVLFQAGKPMTATDFAMLLAIFLGCQFIFQMLAPMQEWMLNQFGFSATAALESATMEADTLSMFLYAGVFAPIFEELLFRGLVLRQLQPYGKRFAIFLSALLFGIFHGNVVQIPFALLVGLVLGYVAVEYNIFWAMLLHMVNNLVLGDMFVRLTQNLSETLFNLLLYAIIILCFIFGLVFLLGNWKEVRSYVKAHPVDNGAVRCFFTSPGVIVFLLACISSTLMSIMPL